MMLNRAPPRPLAAYPSYNPAPRQINGVVAEGEWHLTPWWYRAGPGEDSE